MVDTMSSQQDQLEALLSEAERKERRSRQRAVLYSLIPIILAGILLTFTIWQIKTAQDTLESVQSELYNTQQILADTVEEYEQVKDELLQVQRVLSETQAELEEVYVELEQKQTELQVANDLVAETQQELDETTIKLKAVQAELQITQQQVEDLETQLETLKEDIVIAEEQLRQYREAGTFEPYLCSIDPQHVKEAPYNLYIGYSEEHTKVYETLIRDRFLGIPFSINGSSLEEGLTPPTMLPTFFKRTICFQRIMTPMDDLGRNYNTIPVLKWAI